MACSTGTISSLAVTAVTGGGSGIGAAFVDAAQRRGEAVVVVDMDPATRPVTTAAGHVFVELDVADAAGWHRVADTIGERFGRLTRAFLNVGRGTAPQPVDILQISDELYLRAFAVNCHGVVNGLRALAPLMTGVRGASIVVTGSVRGLWPAPLDPVYSMTKHALVGLVRSVAPRLMEDCGISVNLLCPGPTLTDATAAVVQVDAYRSAPWQTPDDVARAAFDVIEAGVTGEVFVVIAGTLSRCELPVPTY